MTVPLAFKRAVEAFPGVGAVSALQAHILDSDEQALDLVHCLSASFRLGAIRRDRARLPADGEIASLTLGGFFGMTVPKAFGGAGVSARTLAEAFHVLSAADASIGLMSQNHFCWLPVIANGAARQAAHFFDRILAGDRIGYLPSPNAAPGPLGHEPAIRRTWDGWRITGQRRQAPDAMPAQWFAFTLRVDPADYGSSLVFFIDAASKDITRSEGTEGSGRFETLIFEDIFVPDSHVFPLLPVNRNGRSFQFNAGLIHAAIALGIADGALSDACAYVRDLDLPRNEASSEDEQPFVVAEYIKCSAMAQKAGASLSDAARAVDQASGWPSTGTVLNARLAVAEARRLCSEAANRISEVFLLLADVGATLGKYGFDRHRRSVRTHSLLDPLQWWEYHLSGGYLTGRTRPENPYF